MPKFSYSNKICGWPGLHRFSLKKLTRGLQPCSSQALEQTRMLFREKGFHRLYNMVKNWHKRWGYGHHGTWVSGIEEKIVMKLSDK